MKTSVKNKIKNDTQPALWAGDFFISKPGRTVEWLGGVNYENLQKALTQIKSLLLERPDEEVHLLVNSYGGVTGVGMSFYDAVKSWLRPLLGTLGSGVHEFPAYLFFFF